MLKTLIRNPIGLFVLSWLIAMIMAFIMITIRWRTANPTTGRTILEDHDGFILVFWHARIIAMPWLWPRRHPMNALQSPHPDGRLLAHTVNHLGVRTVWGSSNRNALSGLRGLKRILDQGKVAAITPDGPRGPARTAAMGPIALANLTRKPIVPVAWSVDRFWRAPGWDGMIIPKPFSRGVMIWGEPLMASPPADPKPPKPKPPKPKPQKPNKDALENQRRALEAAINDVTDQADAYFTSRTPAGRSHQ
jgi:lysophospholipid acyltransferase (LPLAT)-like uncharacterized protein